MSFKFIHPWGRPIAGLNAKEYEHERDAASLRALKVNGLLDRAIKAFSENTFEKMDKLNYVGSNIRVTARSMPYLHRCVERACEILNISEVPAVYVIENPCLNAFTCGFSHPILCLHNSLIDRLTNEEIMFVIGHELGHIKSEHCQYDAIGRMLKFGMQKGISLIPVVGQWIEQIVAPGQEYLYYDWQRKSELTADRAGLLVCQNLRASISALAKIGGYPQKAYRAMDVNDFLDQAREFEDMGQETSNKIANFLITFRDTHPWTVQRAKELMLWVQSGEYSRVMLRNTEWLEKELDRLSSAAQKATEKYEKKREAADQAAGVAGKRAEKRTLRKQKHAAKAEAVMAQAADSEQLLREIYRSASPKQVERHTKKTLGRLIPIERDPAATLPENVGGGEA